LGTGVLLENNHAKQFKIPVLDLVLLDGVDKKTVPDSKLKKIFNKQQSKDVLWILLIQSHNISIIQFREWDLYMVVMGGWGGESTPLIIFF
jgi:hypothetical protein